MPADKAAIAEAIKNALGESPHDLLTDLCGSI
jgi:hypothetical protein